MRKNKRGAALLQVLMVTVILAGLTAMLLRVSISRISNARLSRREAVSTMLVNACQAEVNLLWAAKTPEAFARDLAHCAMYCPDSQCDPGNIVREYDCGVMEGMRINGVGYQVTAVMEPITANDASDQDGQCKISYRITDAGGSVDVVM